MERLIKFPANTEEALKFSRSNIRFHWSNRDNNVSRAIILNQISISRKLKSGIK